MSTYETKPLCDIFLKNVIKIKTTKLYSTRNKFRNIITL